MATNRADTLDPALLRPGRLDRKIEFPMPSRRERRLIFQTCTSKMNLGPDVDLEDCAYTFKRCAAMVLTRPCRCFPTRPSLVSRDCGHCTGRGSSRSDNPHLYDMSKHLISLHSCSQKQVCHPPSGLRGSVEGELFGVICPINHSGISVL